MSTTRCTGIRKDGQPCQANGLEQYGGLCLAHGAPPEQAREWRSLGGKNSAAAVRFAKNIPEPFQELLELLKECRQKVLDGDLSAANSNAISNNVKMALEAYSRAEEVMEKERADEVRAAAAEHLGVPANLDVLEEADRIYAQLERRRAEALVEQGFARFTAPAGPGQPPQVLLNKKGQTRFGHLYFENRQQMLEGIEDTLVQFQIDGPRLPEIPDLPLLTMMLNDLQVDIEDTQSQVAQQSAEGPFDPLTGRAFTKLPVGVMVSPTRDNYHYCLDDPHEALEEQLEYIKEVHREIEDTSEMEEYKRRKAAQEKEERDRAYFDARLKAAGQADKS